MEGMQMVAWACLIALGVVLFLMLGAMVAGCGGRIEEIGLDAGPDGGDSDSDVDADSDSDSDDPCAASCLNGTCDCGENSLSCPIDCGEPFWSPCITPINPATCDAYCDTQGGFCTESCLGVVEEGVPHGSETCEASENQQAQDCGAIWTSTGTDFMRCCCGRAS